MIIIMKKDGQIVTDDGNPVEGKALDNAAMILADPQDGDSIVYDATAGMWKAGGGGSGSFAPDISNPQDGDTLVYNASQQKWVNGASSGGVFFVNITIDDDTGTATLDKTWQEIQDAAETSTVIARFAYDDNIYSEHLTTIDYTDTYNACFIGFAGDQIYSEVFKSNSSNGYPSRTLG